MEQDHYRVLGVAPTASPAEIAHAYRELVRRHHPDSGSDPSVEGDLDEVVAAYAVLRDPRRRAEYDSQRGLGRPTRAAPAARPPRQDPDAPWIQVGPVRRHF